MEDMSSYADSRDIQAQKVVQNFHVLMGGEQERAAGSIVDDSKMQRKKAYEVVMCMNFNCQQMMGMDLNWYHVTETEEREVDPFEWLVLTVTSDQGPEMMAAIGWFQNKARMNMIHLPDGNHGLWNDCKGDLVEHKFHTHMLTGQVAFGLHYKPFNESLWFSKAKEVMRSWLLSCNPHVDPIIQHCLPEICEDLEMDVGVVGTDEGMQIVLQVLGNDEVIWSKMQAVSLGRWFEYIQYSKKFMKKWGLKKCALMCLLVFTDQLHMAEFKKIRTAMNVASEKVERDALMLESERPHG
jgi:hypothetical protein